MVAVLLMSTLLVVHPAGAEPGPPKLVVSLTSFPDTLRDFRIHVLLEHLSEEADDDVDIEELLSLSLDLNSASALDLARIPGISLMAVDSVLARRRIRRFADLADIYMLEIAEADRRLLAAFTHIGSSAGARRQVRAESAARFSRRVETARGYVGENPAFLGSPNRIRSRTSVTYGPHSAALTVDKPAGARMVWSPTDGLYLFDRIHGYASVRLAEGMRVTIGDFRAEYGQGLTIWSGASFGRGREPVRGVMRSSRGLTGTATTMDDRVLRGLALSMRPSPGVRLDLFASARRVDAAIDTMSADGRELVLARRMARTAHRTELEFSRRNALTERSAGGAVTLTHGPSSIGLAMIAGNYSVPIAPGDRPDTYHSAGGAEFAQAGVHALTRVHQTDVFAEMSIDGTRMITGVRTGVGRDFEAIATVRRHSPGSDNPFAAGFASRSSPLANEYGGYIGTRLRISESTTISAFADVVRHPWVRYQIPRPTVATDQFIEMRHRPRRWWDLSIDLRRRTYESRLTLDSVSVPVLERGSRQTLRIDSRVMASPGLRLNIRAERALSTSESRAPLSGYLLYHEVTTALTSWSDLTVRLTHFQIDGFDSRIYAYERDVIGAFTTHMHTGSGRRMYAMFNLRSRRKTVLQIRAARTWLDGVERIGSGATTIEGNRATDMSLLLMKRL